MPTRQKALCTEPGCRNLATHGTKCDEHYKPPRRNPRYYRKWYSLSIWKRARKIQLGKQPLCEECLRQNRITPAEVVDHIIPHDGVWDLFVDQDNLQSLCERCHNVKTAREDGGFGNRKSEGK